MFLIDGEEPCACMHTYVLMRLCSTPTPLFRSNASTSWEMSWPWPPFPSWLCNVRTFGTWKQTRQPNLFPLFLVYLRRPIIGNGKGPIITRNRKLSLSSLWVKECESAGRRVEIPRALHARCSSSTMVVNLSWQLLLPPFHDIVPIQTLLTLMKCIEKTLYTYNSKYVHSENIIYDVSNEVHLIL